MSNEFAASFGDIGMIRVNSEHNRHLPLPFSGMQASRIALGRHEVPKQGIR